MTGIRDLFSKYVVARSRAERWRGRSTRTWTFNSRDPLERDQLGPRARLELTTESSAWFHLSASVARDDEDGALVLHLGVPFARAWLSLSRPTRRQPQLRPWEYGFSLTKHEGVGDEAWLFWRAGAGDSARGCVCITDKVLGRTKYTSEIVHDVEVDVPMPERSYRWRVELRRDTWTRPRWPFAKVVMRAHCDALKGEQIPIPGKGENGWDCGDDATFGSTFPAHTVADAVAKIAASAIETRIERGWDWTRPPSTRAA